MYHYIHYIIDWHQRRTFLFCFTFPSWNDDLTWFRNKMIIFVRLKILLLFSGIVMGERDGSFIKRLQIKTKLFYSTMTARSALECAIACFMDNRCGAANFNTAIEQCQLIDESIASTEEQFISNVDWTILSKS